MADKKTFTIEINGIEQAYNNVIQLKTALLQLDDIDLNIAAGSDITINNLTQSIGDLSNANVTLSQSYTEINSAIADNTSVSKTNTEEAQTKTGSIKSLKDAVKKLKEQYENLSEAERNSPKGTQLVVEIKTLEKELSQLEEKVESHLAILGELGTTLDVLTNGFKDANGAVGSLSGILSNGADVLKLFGTESNLLNQAMLELSKVTKTLNALQALHTSIVSKDSIVMKAATTAKQLYTAATQGSSIALKGFQAALVATGVGAFIVLIGTLIAHFDEVKEAIGDAVGGMDKLDNAISVVEPVIVGLGNTLIQLLLMPIKQIINVVEGLMNVFKIFQEDGIGGFGKALEEIGNTAKKGVEIQIDGLNVVKNFNAGVEKSMLKATEEANLKKRKDNAALTEDFIKDKVAQNGANWKFTEEGIKAHQSYFEDSLALYEKDSEDYKRIMRDKWEFERKLQEKETKEKENADKKANKQAKSSGTKKDPKKEQEDYLNALKNIQNKTEAYQTETEEKQVAHLKKMAENVKTQDAIKYMQDANSKELTLQEQKHQKEIEDLNAHQKELQDKYKGNTSKLNEINEAFASQQYALEEKQAKEIFDLKSEQNSKLRKIAEKVNKANIDQKLAEHDQELSAESQFINEKRKLADELNKELVKRNGLGLIDIGGTKENYKQAIEADKEYLEQLELNHLKQKKLLNEELLLVEANSQEAKDIKAKMLDQDNKYADEKEKINKRVTENIKNEKNVQQQYFEDLHEKISEKWDKISEKMAEAAKFINSIFQAQLDDIKSKQEEVNKQYDAVVEKRQQAQDKLLALEEEAKEASGGRAVVVQEQIARQMEANGELASQEKDLAKKKEKLDKEAAKKEKQMKKVELTQNLISSIVNTALGVTKALSMGPIIGPILAAVVGAAGAVQTATIAKQISKLEDGGLLKGKRHSQGGMRIEGTNIEVEGDEYVVNRVSTNKNMGLISYINQNRKELTSDDINNYFSRTGSKAREIASPSKRMYEEGGTLTNLEVVDTLSTPANDKILDAISQINFRPVVSVVDIASAQNNIAEVRDIAGA